MTLHILTTTSPKLNSAADTVDGSLRGSKFFLCRSYYSANQQLQRSSSNHSKSLMSLKALNAQCDSTLIKYVALVNNRLDSLGEPRTHTSFTSGWWESPSAVKHESGPVDPCPLCGAVLPRFTLRTNTLGFPGGSHPIRFYHTAMSSSSLALL